MSDFHLFATAIHQRFTELSQGELFVAGGDEDIFSHYLASFPPGSDPIYRVRTEHDCSCCKQFIRNIGRLVAINGAEVETIWDVPDLVYPYKEVAAVMHRFIEDRVIAGRAAERARLVEILEKKQDEARLGMTEEEIRARIAELA